MIFHLFLSKFRGFYFKTSFTRRLNSQKISSYFFSTLWISSKAWFLVTRFSLTFTCFLSYDFQCSALISEVQIKFYYKQFIVTLNCRSFEWQNLVIPLVDSSRSSNGDQSTNSVFTWKWNWKIVFTSNAPSQSVELRNSGGLSWILTSVCWISSMEGMSLVPMWWSASASMLLRFLAIHEHIDWSVRYAHPHPYNQRKNNIRKSFEI